MSWITAMKHNKLILNTLGLFLIYSLCGAAMAQVDLGANISDKLQGVQTALRAVAGVVVTIALIYVGMKMVFAAAEWKDVAPVFWGAVLIGGAAALGSVLIT